MCQTHFDLSEKSLQLLQVSLSFGDTTSWLLTIKDFWSVRKKVIVYIPWRQYKERGAGVQKTFILTCLQLVAAKDGHKLRPGATVYSGNGGVLFGASGYFPRLAHTCCGQDETAGGRRCMKL